MSMQQMQDTKRNQSGSASVTKGDQSRGALAHLRGLTYDQQLAALGVDATRQPARFQRNGGATSLFLTAGGTSGQEQGEQQVG